MRGLMDVDMKGMQARTRSDSDLVVRRAPNGCLSLLVCQVVDYRSVEQLNLVKERKDDKKDWVHTGRERAWEWTGRCTEGRKFVPKLSA